MRRNQSAADKVAVLLNHPASKRAISLPTLTYVTGGIGQTVFVWEIVTTICLFRRRIPGPGCVLLPKSVLSLLPHPRSGGSCIELPKEPTGMPTHPLKCG